MQDGIEIIGNPIKIKVVGNELHITIIEKIEDLKTVENYREVFNVLEENIRNGAINNHKEKPPVRIQKDYDDSFITSFNPRPQPEYVPEINPRDVRHPTDMKVKAFFKRHKWTILKLVIFLIVVFIAIAILALKAHNPYALKLWQAGFGPVEGI